MDESGLSASTTGSRSMNPDMTVGESLKFHMKRTWPNPEVWFQRSPIGVERIRNWQASSEQASDVGHIYDN
jgi:hypothetical protein